MDEKERHDLERHVAAYSNSSAREMIPASSMARGSPFPGEWSATRKLAKSAWARRTKHPVDCVDFPRAAIAYEQRGPSGATPLAIQNLPYGNPISAICRLRTARSLGPRKFE